MKVFFSNDLCLLLQSPDFKKQVEGVNFLIGLINTQRKEFIEIIDIVFRWVWLRLQENTNTQAFKSILEMLQVLIPALHEENYILHEMEANMFFPIICEKSGQNNAQFRTMIRGILHVSPKIYPIEKVFTFVLIGYSSKNTKSKVECLEELASLIQEHGLSIAQTKDIKTIAKYASSSDNNVRTAVVSTIGEIFKYAGEKI